jgi:hypothetical protein
MADSREITSSHLIAHWHSLIGIVGGPIFLLCDRKNRRFGYIAGEGENPQTVRRSNDDE